MAKFDVRVAAAALDIDERWLSVTLTRFPIAGVTCGRRGVTRTLSLDAVVCIGIAHALVRDAGVPVEPALALAHRMLGAPRGEIRFGADTLRLSMAMDEARGTARTRLAHAIERSVESRRGRPPARRLQARNS